MRLCMRPSLKSIFALALALVAGALFAGAQEVGAIIAVQDFAPADSLEANIATELIRTYIATSSLVRVIDSYDADDSRGATTAPKPDLILSGNVSSSEGTITISIRLIEIASSRIVKSERETCSKDNFYARIETLASDLKNSIVIEYIGSSIKSVKTLIGINRFDEAGRRLDAYEARAHNDPAIPELRRAIGIGQAKAWLSQARDEYAAAQAAKSGGDALALQSKSSVEAALDVLPDHPNAESTRSECVEFLHDSVLPYLQKLELKRRKDAYSSARASLRSGNAAAALETLDQFFELTDETMKDGEYNKLRTEALSGIARGIARQALDAQKTGQDDVALVLATSALNKAPDDAFIRRTYMSAAEKAQKAENIRREAFLIGDEKDNFAARAGWELTAEAGFRTLGEGSIDLPLSGALQAASLGVRDSLFTSDRLRIFDYAQLSAGSSNRPVQTQGYDGQLAQNCYALELGAGIAWIKSNWATGMRLGLSNEYWEYSGTYTYQGEQKISDALFGLGLNAALQTDYYLSRHLSIGGALGAETLLFFTYGLSSNVQFAIRTSYSF
jgi:hypothetical protein